MVLIYEMRKKFSKMYILNIKLRIYKKILNFVKCFMCWPHPSLHISQVYWYKLLNFRLAFELKLESFNEQCPNKFEYGFDSPSLVYKLRYIKTR